MFNHYVLANRARGQQRRWKDYAVKPVIGHDGLICIPEVGAHCKPSLVRLWSNSKRGAGYEKIEKEAAHIRAGNLAGQLLQAERQINTLKVVSENIGRLLKK